MSSYLEPVLTAAQQHACAFVLTKTAVLSVRGSDAARYLHARMTQDIKLLPQGCARATLLLNAQGKVLGSCTVLREADGFTVIADTLPDKNSVAAFIKTLLQFKVSDDVVVQAHPFSKVVTIQGAQSSAVLAQLGLTVESLAPATHALLALQSPLEFQSETGETRTLDSIQLLNLPRAAVPGVDLLLPAAALEAVCARLKSVLRNEADWQTFRIWSGIPEVGSELTEKSIATEFEISSRISFNKGCYVGQEVVEMSTARGRPNRRLYLLQADTTLDVAVGSPIVAETPDGKPVGEITSVARVKASEAQTEDLPLLCLGFVKTSVAAETELYVNAIRLMPRLAGQPI